MHKEQVRAGGRTAFSARKRLFLAAVAVAALLVVVFSAAPFGSNALAVMMDEQQAQGSATMQFGTKTQLRKGEFGDHEVIAIENVGTNPCFVRVEVYDPTAKKLMFEHDGRWREDADGFWYYLERLEPGDITDNLTVRVVETVAGYDGMPVIEVTPQETLTANDRGSEGDWSAFGVELKADPLEILED